MSNMDRNVNSFGHHDVQYSYLLPRIHFEKLFNRSTSTPREKRTSTELHTTVANECRETFFGSGQFCEIIILFHGNGQISSEVLFNAVNAFFSEQLSQNTNHWTFLSKYREKKNVVKDDFWKFIKQFQSLIHDYEIAIQIIWPIIKRYILTCFADSRSLQVSFAYSYVVLGQILDQWE